MSDNVVSNLVNKVSDAVKKELAESSPVELGVGGLILGYVLSTTDKERNAIIGGAIGYFGADKINELAGGVNSAKAKKNASN